jgi:O-antigen ligase
MTGDNTNDRDYVSLSKTSAKNADEREVESSYRSLENPAVRRKTSGLPEVRNLDRTVDAAAKQKESRADAESLTTGSHSDELRQTKETKRAARDRKLLSRDRWLARNGHTLSYVGLFLFTLTVYFRPYELIPGLSGFTSLALIIALLTLAIYVPTQFITEGNVTAMPAEVKCVLFLVGWSLITIPIAKDPAMAWHLFSESFVKVAIIFVVMVNTLRSSARLKGLMWLGIAIGVMLSYQAIDYYDRGIFKTEGYRVSVDFGGMFGNPNDMSLHLVMFIPIAIALGFATRSLWLRLLCFGCAGLMVFAAMVTQSRGGFLGLLTMGAVLVWKLGEKKRVQVIIISAVISLLVILVAPGNYAMRMLSIFVPSLDPVGSADARRDLLERSIVVALRNPLGIGLGNSPIIGFHNQQTHNAYTQVATELGWIALVVYLILITSPLKKLGAMIRQLSARGKFSWSYYVAIGLQASLAGYIVTSFFGSVAYNWYLYFPVAYAVCLRRMHIVQNSNEPPPDKNGQGLKNYFEKQGA